MGRSGMGLGSFPIPSLNCRTAHGITHTKNDPGQRNPLIAGAQVPLCWPVTEEGADLRPGVAGHRARMRSWRSTARTGTAASQRAATTASGFGSTGIRTACTRTMAGAPILRTQCQLTHSSCAKTSTARGAPTRIPQLSRRTGRRKAEGDSQPGLAQRRDGEVPEEPVERLGCHPRRGQ